MFCIFLWDTEAWKQWQGQSKVVTFFLQIPSLAFSPPASYRHGSSFIWKLRLVGGNPSPGGFHVLSIEICIIIYRDDNDIQNLTDFYPSRTRVYVNFSIVGLLTDKKIDPACLWAQSIVSKPMCFLNLVYDDRATHSLQYSNFLKWTGPFKGVYKTVCPFQTQT
jgi:hypothetical protein